MKVIIADDDQAELKYLKSILNKEKDIELVGDAVDGKATLKLISDIKPEVAFLDISMPSLNGIEVAGRLLDDIIYVFITAHDNYALEAFQVGAIDYILKPININRVRKSLDRIRKLLPIQQTCNKITFNKGGTISSVEINKIIFIEKAPGVKKLNIFTRDQQDYMVSGKLNEYERKLKAYGFARSHKSFIINVNKIEQLIPWGDKSYLAIMENSKKEVLVSRKYAPLVKSMFGA